MPYLGGASEISLWIGNNIVVSPLMYGKTYRREGFLTLLTQRRNASIRLHETRQTTAAGSGVVSLLSSCLAYKCSGNRLPHHQQQFAVETVRTRHELF
jgi:hypothetical protein